MLCYFYPAVSFNSPSHDSHPPHTGISVSVLWLIGALWKTMPWKAIWRPALLHELQTTLKSTETELFTDLSCNYSDLCSFSSNQSSVFVKVEVLPVLIALVMTLDMKRVKIFKFLVVLRKTDTVQNLRKITSLLLLSVAGPF